jgi:hypothetical protein
VPPTKKPLHLVLLAAVVLALVALYLPLATNPGWLSHDELQWGRAAQVERFADLPWVGWTAVETFQWRPLTFNLWLALAWLAFDAPVAMHSLWVALGGGVCMLLFLCLRAAGATRCLAAAGAAGFAMNPFAVYVHGWTATLAELLWVGSGLVLALVVLRAPTGARRGPATAGLVLGTLALLSKEAALALLPLLILAWWLSGRERRWLAAALGAALPTLAYLLLRGPLLLFGERPFDSYVWSLAAVPMRWTEFLLWPFLVTSFELDGITRASPARLALAAAMALTLVAIACRAGPRFGIALLLGGGIAIGPALVLLQAYPQYGYAGSLVTVACLALAWPRIGAVARTSLLLASLLAGWHGFNVQREMRRAGELEAEFTPALEDVLRQRGSARLVAERGPDAWIYRRLALVTPVNPGAERRVVVVTDRAAATHVIRADGRIDASR